MCLQELLKQKKIQNSELFGAFLMGSSDSSLFSPESMGGKHLCIHMCVLHIHEPLHVCMYICMYGVCISVYVCVCLLSK